MSHRYARSTLMRMGPVVLVALVSTLPARPSLAAQQLQAPSTSEGIKVAEESYYGALFEQAIRHLNDYLARQDLINAERVDGLKLLGSCWIALGEREKARAAVEEILALEPDFLIDPDTVPPGLLQVYFRVLDDQGKLALRRGIRSVAVLDLTNSSVTARDDMDPLRQGLADAMITCLAADTCLVVVERERLEYLRKEIGLQRTSEFDQETAVTVGKLIAAQLLLMGGFTRIGDKVRIDVRLVRTETSQVVWTQSAEGTIAKIFALVEKIAKPAGEFICQRPLPGPSKQDASYQALLAYSRGLDFLDRGEMNEAYKSFQVALETSPDFEKARRRMRQLAPLLASQQTGER